MELSISELEAFQKKVAEAKEKNKARTDPEIYYVVRGTPNKYEIKTITARKKKTGRRVTKPQHIYKKTRHDIKQTFT